ncbi:roadblock/LC7 domain-containing protein [Pyrobaculum neutrophilum]|uniref:Roadblock/LC7 family protein n=1 Tax=Pyrobaculum neutrophilum (strain DSM 2338 / JCM 9278 / NBRC 100436 / V24Sta) TaxID=444157 RepID=B1YA92_PYRNV|nr:roadblock/LC7 domain-containing protein [Pyrobaculum neutrophilum]ACB39066.1 Roadblock/LC7 family protein [Pyrobaculum neutrophilum V24Sta]
MESKYREELSLFLSRTGGDVLGAVMARRDGLPVASAAPGMDPKAISALAALALGTLRKVGDELKIGGVRQVVAYYDSRVIVMWPARELYIIAVANADANIGLIFLELERLAKRLAEL